MNTVPRKRTVYTSKRSPSTRSAQSSTGELPTQIQLGMLYAETGEIQNAEHSFREAQQLQSQTEQLASLAKTYSGLALVHRTAGQLELANADIQKSINIIESERMKVADFDTRASYFSSVHLYYQ